MQRPLKNMKFQKIFSVMSLSHGLLIINLSSFLAFSCSSSQTATASQAIHRDSQKMKVTTMTMTMRIRRRLLFAVLLLLLSLDSVRSTWLVCEEETESSSSSNNNNEESNDSDGKKTTKNKLKCQLDMSLQDVLDTWNADCELSEIGVSCKMELDRDSIDNTNGFVSLPPKDQLKTACDQHNEVCIVSQTVSRFKFSTLEALKQATQKVDNTETTDTTATNSDETSTESTETTTNADVDDSNSEQSHHHHTHHTQYTSSSTTMSSSSEKMEFGIRVGNYMYKEPWDQYAAPLARVLRARAYLWRTSPTSFQQQYAFANALLDIGISHFTSVTEEDHSPGFHSGDPKINTDSFDLSLAIRALEQGQVHYLRILDIYQGTDQESIVHASLAALNLQWGEILQSHHYYNHFDFDATSTQEDYEDEVETIQKYNQLAMQRFQVSEQHYKLSLETVESTTTTNNNPEETVDGENENDDNDNKKEEGSIVITENHINLAHVSQRIGRCMVNSIQALAMAEEEVMAHNNMNGEQAQANLAETLSNALPQLDKLMKIVAQAEKKFEQAVNLYRAAIAQEDDPAKKINLKNNLATTLQDYSVATSYDAASNNNIPKTIALQAESVVLSQEILDYMSEYDRPIMIGYVASGLYALSGFYMQLGQYDETSEHYDKAMDWYDMHDLEPVNVVGSFEQVADEDLQVYEDQLTEYHELLREINMPDGYPDQHVMYEPNDAYEADLHAALASAHLSRDENLMAIDHFLQAIRLYEDDRTGENLSRSIADCKTSLAAAYFKDSQFQQSAEAHREAMEIYREVVGEGKNPMLASLADQLGVNIDDLGQVNNLDLLASSNIQELISNLDVDEEVKASLEALTSKGNGKQDTQSSESSTNSHQTAGTNANRQKGQQNHQHDNAGAAQENKAQQKVHEELIDLEKLRQSALNATVHEEL
ncbi:expressed unknown protein [Seminavis robusta]|uniref:Uncharacterized protein n=1 Tax=Seminavis robusta TaxID=568900 RepID=A0A9N8HR19_9STRA|nr:expressed unknown protein [Seminavis robusta]|eukprot:Sro1036_g234020.1 n/a (939) ;mRNA; r:8111-11087